MALNIQNFYSKEEINYLTHSFHSYPAKLIPQIAGSAIKEFSEKNDTVLDPFCGSGTSLIEANLLNRNAVGFDLNPLACLIAKTKTSCLNEQELENSANELLKKLHSRLKNEQLTLNDFVVMDGEYFEEKAKWFQKPAIIALQNLKELINEIEDSAIKDFCLVAFSSILKEVSSAKSVYKLSMLKKQRKVNKLSVLNAFKEETNTMLRAMKKFNEKSNSNSMQIYCKDARKLNNPIEEVDFIVTKPPAISFDLLKYFKMNFWWLDLRDVKEINKGIIGVRRIGKQKKVKEIGIRIADELVEEVLEKKKCDAIALSNYYADMKKVFTEMQGVLKEGKHCCVYATNSTLRGIDTQSPEIFCEIGKETGFELENRIKRVIPKKQCSS